MTIEFNNSISANNVMKERTLGRRRLVRPHWNFRIPVQTERGRGGSQRQMIPSRVLLLHIYQA